ncbi:sigma-70 domain-containing protein, partial [Acinetobacter baumannii]
KKKARYLSQILGRRPTIDEIAKAAGIDVDKARFAFSSEKQLLSLDACVGDDQDTSLDGIIADEKTAEPESDANRHFMGLQIFQALSGLSA